MVSRYDKAGMVSRDTRAEKSKNCGYGKKEGAGVESTPLKWKGRPKRAGQSFYREIETRSEIFVSSEDRVSNIKKQLDIFTWKAETIQ